MAEVFGAVAGGLDLAKIVIKLKSLVNQMAHAPDTLRSLVKQVETYGSVLKGTELNDILKSGISPSIPPSLQAAALQCHDAVEQLSSVVEDLSKLSKTSSWRRKMLPIKFVLQRDSIDEFERRLNAAVQCLILALSVYGFVQLARLQRQPMGLLPRASVAIGGSIVARIMRFNLPVWSSSFVFEIFAQHSTAGWQVSWVFPKISMEDDSHFDFVYDLLRTNNELEIYQALERRDISIHDLFLVDGHHHSIAELALATSSWKSLNYLLEKSPHSLNFVAMNYIDDHPYDEENVRQLEIFLKKSETLDNFRIPEFVHFDGDGASYDRLREQFWSEDKYYGKDFLTQRHEIALNLAYFSDSSPLTYRFFRHVLSPSGFLRKQDIFQGRFWTKTVPGTNILLHGLASAISAIPWRILKDGNHKESSAYLEGTSQNPEKYVETAMLDGWALITSEVVSFWDNLHELVPGQDSFKEKTALFFSFKVCFRKLFASPTGITTWERSRSMRFRLIEASLRLWLNILIKAGIDLEKYGEKESKLFRDSTHRSFLMKDVTYPRNRRSSRTDDEGDTWGEELEVDLIGLQYGANVNEWKLWWSEPSDVFAGDFWRLVEPPNTPVPGAWPED